MSQLSYVSVWLFFFFFNDTATTEIYTLSLHDALPIFTEQAADHDEVVGPGQALIHRRVLPGEDRKSTRLNSSHVEISYAVFCLKKKKNSVIRRRLEQNKEQNTQ